MRSCSPFLPAMAVLCPPSISLPPHAREPRVCPVMSQLSHSTLLPAALLNSSSCSPRPLVVAQRTQSLQHRSVRSTSLSPIVQPTPSRCGSSMMTRTVQNLSHRFRFLMDPQTLFGTVRWRMLSRKVRYGKFQRLNLVNGNDIVLIESWLLGIAPLYDYQDH